jgi:predicted ArsR family transcriptional regulator
MSQSGCVPGPAGRRKKRLPPMPDVRVHRVLASISRIAVLETLREAGDPMGVRELAERMNLHDNTVRKHLDLLVENGFATRLRDGGGRRGRPRYVYTAVAPEASPTDVRLRNYRLLASVFAAYLDDADDPEAAAEEAGRRFGVRSADADVGDRSPATALQRVVQMLDDIGFQPELAADGAEIRLHHCPFHELARDRQSVVCATHLGLIRGALAQLGAPEEVVRLVPFVTPTLCVVEIGPRPRDRAT